MSLVQYDSSSDSEGSDTEQNPSVPPQSSPTKKSKKPVFYVNLPSKDDSDDDEQPSKQMISAGPKSLADLLPAPKNTNPYLLSKSNTTSIVPRTVKKRPLSATKDSPNTKEQQRSEPDSAEPTKSSNDIKAGGSSEDEDEDEDAESDNESEPVFKKAKSKPAGPFFHLGADVTKPTAPKPSTKKEPPSKPMSRPSQTKTAVGKSVQRQEKQEQQVIDDPNAMYAYGVDPAAYYQYYQYYYSQDQANPTGTSSEMLDAEVLSQLGGKRRGEGSGVQIKSVSQAEMLPSEEWRRQASELEPITKDTTEIKVTGDQRRTNNIVALAAQAQQNQSRMEQRFAQERMAKRESRKKYGF